MNNYLLLVVLPNIDVLIGILAFFGFIIPIIILFIRLLSYDKLDQEVIKWVRRFLIASIFLSFITCFIPTKKDIIELKIISVVSGLKGVDKVPQNIIDKLNNFLEVGKEAKHE